MGGWKVVGEPSIYSLFHLAFSQDSASVESEGVCPRCENLKYMGALSRFRFSPKG